MLAEVQFYDVSAEKIASEKLYTYRIPIGMKLKKGDQALVYVESDDRQYLNGWRIVKIYKTYKTCWLITSTVVSF